MGQNWDKYKILSNIKGVEKVLAVEGNTYLLVTTDSEDEDTINTINQYLLTEKLIWGKVDLRRLRKKSRYCDIITPQNLKVEGNKLVVVK